MKKLTPILFVLALVLPALANAQTVKVAAKTTVTCLDAKDKVTKKKTNFTLDFAADAIRFDGFTWDSFSFVGIVSNREIVFHGQTFRQTNPFGGGSIHGVVETTPSGKIMKVKGAESWAFEDDGCVGLTTFKFKRKK